MALYNNGFPATYQYYTPVAPMQVQQPQVQQSQGQQNGIIWVQGEAGAKSYLVAPNNTVQLWDSESQVIYLKSADASGMPSMKVLDYTIRDSGKSVPAVATELCNYATKEEMESMSEQLSVLREKVDILMKRRRREEDE